MRLAITGDGPSRGELEAALPGAVFLGRREGDDLARVYAAVDVFVHTGTSETFGQTLQEAAATGLPVVAPAAGGPLDLVEHGQTGLLFEPGAPESEEGSLRSCVAQLTCAEDAWERRALMGEAGAAKVAGRTWDALTEALVERYVAVSRHGSRVRIA